MAPEDFSEDEDAVLRLVRLAAERRAMELGITATDYLIGILEGQFPRFTKEELSVIASLSPEIRQQN